VEEDQSKFDSIVFVLANLSVRQDKRRRGIAGRLLDACDKECKAYIHIYIHIYMVVFYGHYCTSIVIAI